ncbi:YezD family protein [Caldalkalibacillus salinus]|uniref:YezD family protein n=1 Tax=Caldalkalibacillus salinus TaxID=2803787 RepID=UPI00192453C2|nr:YezD family protein [Caldalkalibacillus salinus]
MPKNETSTIPHETYNRITEALSGLEYGSVQIVVHDSQIVEIHRLDKQRFPLEKGNKQKDKRQS